MATGETYHIGERSISSGGKVHSRLKVVTAEIMKTDDKTFSQLVKAGRVKKGAPPKPKKKIPPRGIAQAVKNTEGRKPNEEPVLREDRILQAIRDMHNKDGNPKSKDDFTDKGQPRTDSLDILVLVDGEDEIKAEERDTAWEKYQKEKATQ